MTCKDRTFELIVLHLIFTPILGRSPFWHIFLRLKPPTREQFVLWCGICMHLLHMSLQHAENHNCVKHWIVEVFSSSFTNQIRFGARILCPLFCFPLMLWGVGSRSTQWISSYVSAIAKFDNLQLLSTFLDTGFWPLCWHRGRILRLLWLNFPGLWLFYCSSPSQWDWKNGCFSVSRSCISGCRGPCHWLHPSFRHFGLRGYAKVPSVKYVLNSDDCGFVPSIPSTIRYKIERVFWQLQTKEDIDWFFCW